MNGAVQIQASMSLDGFIAGPGDDMDWIFEHVGAGDGAADVMEATGAILAGRRTYDMGRRSGRTETSEPYGGGWSGAQFVLTHRPRDDDPSVTVLSGDIGKAVQIGLAAAGDKNLGLFGGDVGAQCLARGLADEILVFVLPVLLGDGIPLFRDGAESYIRLEQLDSTTSGSSIRMHYRVVREERDGLSRAPCGRR
jgi:dihydrofolate reductase